MRSFFNIGVYFKQNFSSLPSDEYFIALGYFLSYKIKQSEMVSLVVTRQSQATASKNRLVS